MSNAHLSVILMYLGNYGLTTTFHVTWKDGWATMCNQYSNPRADGWL